MRAVICRAWGAVDDLTVEDVAPPAPGRGQVVIDVQATGVNYADSIMVAGRYQTRPTLPFSPGLEAAGIVTQCGDGVTRYQPGDHVMAILPYGGFAERALADEVETFAIPSTMPVDEAGRLSNPDPTKPRSNPPAGRARIGETPLRPESA